MAFYFFTIPVSNSKQSESELNQFVSQNKILTTDKQFVADGSNSFWSICITTIQSEEVFNSKKIKSKRSAIDYKDVLSVEDFTVFAELRKLRKEISDSQGIPAYAVFTNEQLAKMVTENITSKAEMLKVNGVGQSRIEKYAESFLAIVLRVNNLSGSGTKASLPEI